MKASTGHSCALQFVVGKGGAPPPQGWYYQQTDRDTVVIDQSIFNHFRMEPVPCILGLGSWILDPGSWILDPGSRILDHGSWILDPGSWMLDPGSWILDPAVELAI
jgi:hypothetical protein